MNGAHIVAAFEKVGREAVSKCMATGGLGNTSGTNRFFDGILEVLFAHVVPACFAAAWVKGRMIGWKHILPRPLFRGPGIFSMKGGGQVNGAAAAGEVLAMLFLNACEVRLKWTAEPLGQKRDSLAQSLAFTNGDLAITEINVLDA